VATGTEKADSDVDLLFEMKRPLGLLALGRLEARIAELVSALAPIAPVLIVDDGSDEASKSALKGLAAQIYTRAQNGGKGAAVCDGLAWAKELGFTHAFQIDADFQHDVSRCEEFLALAARKPAALICAAPVYDESAPKSRLHGRKIMNFWCVVNTLSHHIKDAMCGFRIYPLEGIVPLLPRTKSRRMSFDAEILILAARAGLEIKWLDLAVRYVNERRAREGQEPVDLDNLGFDDQAAYQILRDGNTVAIFQVESDGMKKLLRKQKP